MELFIDKIKRYDDIHLLFGLKCYESVIYLCMLLILGLNSYHDMVDRLLCILFDG